MKSKSAYEHPQPHACFIQSVEPTIWSTTAASWICGCARRALFKYGSGTGSNFSHAARRRRKLSGGGKSSGLMSFLKIGDRAAGAIKSGGTTRRAAKMVVVDIDHPDIEEYINWKVKEEQKVAALVTGSKVVASKHLKAIMKACVNCEGGTDDCFDPKKNPALKREDPRRQEGAGSGELHPAGHPVRQAGLQGHRIHHLRHRLGFRSLSDRLRPELQQLGRVRTTFLNAVEADGDWDLIGRTTGEVTKTVKARDLWDQIGYAAWASADPGLQFHTTINDWHTCPSAGPIRASNPCSEYMFLDDTACNLASLNLLQFRMARTRKFASTRRAFEHAVRLVDHRPRNLGDDGAVPVQGDRRNSPTSTARLGSATPISAAC